MKKVFLLLSLACAVMVSGTNAAPGKVKKTERPCERLISKYRNSNENYRKLQFNNLEPVEVAKIRRDPKKKKAPAQPKDRTGFSFLQEFAQRTQEKTKQRLDSCIARDKDGKTFAKDYYFYYPLGAWPNGALQSIELYTLNEETGEWSGFRISSTYDEYGNSNNKLIEVTHNGVWTPEIKYIANYTSLGELTLDEVYNYENGEWVGDSKRVTTFDSQNRKTLEEIFIWNTSQKAWNDYQKVEYIYEASRNTNLTKEWNGSQWINSDKMETITDDNGNSVKMELSVWSLENNDWSVTLRVENSYDPDGNITQMISHNYNETLDEFLPDAKEIYIYEENRETQESYGYNYNTREWDGIYKLVETLENNLIVESSGSTWSTGNADWIYESKTLSQYNQQGQPTQINSQLWNGTTWQDNGKTETEYNEFGYEKHVTSYHYASGEWIKESEMTQETDKDGRITSIEAYQTDPETNRWIGSLKEHSQYDENGQDIFNEFFIWDYAANDWVLDERADYFYSDPTNIRNIANTGIAVYTTTGKVTVKDGENESVSIYSANGSLIRRILTDSNCYCVCLDKGIYIIRIKGQSFKVTVR